MKVYIKDGKTFKNKAIVTAFSYKLVRSIYTDLSELTTEYASAISLGDILYDNHGWCGLISDIERDGEKLLIIKCQDITNLFARDIIYRESEMEPSSEETLMSAILGHYQTQSDIVYRLPYLHVNLPSTTTTRMTPSVDYGVWNIKSYIALIRRLQSIYTDISVTNDTLEIVIQKKTLPTKKIFTTNRRVEILEETFSKTSIAKITAYHTDPVSSTDYYMLEDGTITTTFQASGRAEGDWELLQIDGDQDELTQVTNKFKENSYSHKISFLVPKEDAQWDFYDPVMVEVKKQYYNSYIAKKIILDDDTIEYQCGELRTTLSDKINQLI